jgi:hypothetical protein
LNSGSLQGDGWGTPIAPERVVRLVRHAGVAHQATAGPAKASAEERRGSLRARAR